MSRSIAETHPVFAIKVQASTSDIWREFERALALALSDLAEDEYLILTAKRRSYYVQFVGLGAFGMRAEAAGNTYLRDDERLSSADERKLRDLGWYPPDHSKNFHVDAAAPVSHATMAALAVATLRDVFRIGHPGALEYRAFARDCGSIRFPTLKLHRRDAMPISRLSEQR